jgi:hypothetical protein
LLRILGTFIVPEAYGSEEAFRQEAESEERGEDPFTAVTTIKGIRRQAAIRKDRGQGDTRSRQWATAEGRLWFCLASHVQHS